MEIFNTHRLTQKQRFNTALIVGIIASVVIGIAIGYLRRLIAISSGFDFSIVTIAGTYALAYVIRKVGRGVQVKFSILGGVLGFLLVSISNVIAFGYPIISILNLGLHLQILLTLISGSLNNLLMLVYQVFAVYIAYNQSRFI